MKGENRLPKKPKHVPVQGRDMSPSCSCVEGRAGALGPARVPKGQGQVLTHPGPHIPRLLSCSSSVGPTG